MTSNKENLKKDLENLEKEKEDKIACLQQKLETATQELTDETERFCLTLYTKCRSHNCFCHNFYLKLHKVF